MGLCEAVEQAREVVLRQPASRVRDGNHEPYLAGLQRLLEVRDPNAVLRSRREYIESVEVDRDALRSALRSELKVKRISSGTKVGLFGWSKIP